MGIPLSKAKDKTVIKRQIEKAWQEYWETDEKGRHRYNL